MTEHDSYDSPWKEILSTYFEAFTAFFFPRIHQEIDWSRSYERLDKELRQITREAKIGKRFADHLVKVWKKDGQEAWVLVHVEVQGQFDPDFGYRVFVYHYRIHDLYRLPVASLAVLADENPRWYVDGYDTELWGCTNRFRFPSVKVLDYGKQWEMLESSANPFAVVVMAHLRTAETKETDEKRLEYKLSLTKALYRRGWTKQQILDLYRFIDWVMRLPKDMEAAYHKELFRYEEEIRMPYVTTAERIGIEKGEKIGVRKGKAEAIKETAINLFSIETITDEQIAQVTKLDIEEIRRLRQEHEARSGQQE